ncbi:thioredoxin family protein [Streptomyces malaysiensis]|uniref:thioredoxin family protein n=1 Tax=Streptomyces malaysiensis TaxID=92644 RepID=UPI00359C2BB6
MTTSTAGTRAGPRSSCTRTVPADPAAGGRGPLSRCPEAHGTGAHPGRAGPSLPAWRTPSPSCAACASVSRSSTLAGRVKLVKVDIDRNPRLAQRFEVQAVPTLLILDKGKPVARRAGAAPAGTLRSWVEQVAAGRRDSERG